MAHGLRPVSARYQSLIIYAYRRVYGQTWSEYGSGDFPYPETNIRPISVLICVHLKDPEFVHSMDNQMRQLLDKIFYSHYLLQNEHFLAFEF